MAPHWRRVEEEAAEMKIGLWASRARRAIWRARFNLKVEIEKCNARMVSRSRHMADEDTTGLS